MRTCSCLFLLSSKEGGRWTAPGGTCESDRWLLGLPRGEHFGGTVHARFPAALTIATIPAFRASGRVGYALTSAARLGVERVGFP